MYTFTSELELRKSIIGSFRGFGYLNKESTDVILEFSAKNLKQSIDEMLKISEIEISNLVTARVHLLDKVGLDFKGNNFNYYEDKHKKIPPDNAKDNKEISNLYIQKVIKNKDILQEFSKTLEIVSLSSAPEHIINGGWLGSLGTKDPILWALKHNYTISNKDPVLWATENNRNIGGKNPLLWAVENNYKINEIDPISYAIQNNYDILSLLLEEYTILKNKDKNLTIETDKLKQAYEKALKIIDPSLEVQGIINDKSNLGKMLLNMDTTNIPKLGDNVIPTIEEDLKRLTPRKLMQNCSLDLVYKMFEVGEHINGKSEIKENKIKVFICSIKSILNGPINGENIMEELKEINSRKEVHFEYRNNNNIENKIGKFASRIMNEKNIVSAPILGD